MWKDDVELLDDARVARIAEFTDETPTRVIEEAEAFTTFNGDTVSEELDAADNMVKFLAAYED